MGTVTEKLEKVLDTKAAIRNAIVGKGQAVSDTDPFSSYAAKITAISTGVDTSDATATASDILVGKTAYAKGVKVTGSIAGRTASALTASGATVTVPAGYYASQATKSVETALVSYPSINVSTGGLITASVVQAEGYVTAATHYQTKQLDTQAGQTIIPGTTTKTAVAAGLYTTGDVEVAGDPNLVAENIKSGVSIFGVEGTLSTSAEGCLYFDNLEVPSDRFDFRINKSSEQATKFLDLWNMDKIRKIIIFSSIPGGALSANSGSSASFWGLNVELDIPSKSNISGWMFGIRKTSTITNARKVTSDSIPDVLLIRETEEYIILSFSDNSLGTTAYVYPTATYNAIIIPG